MEFTESHHRRFRPHPANANMLSLPKEMAILLRHTPLYSVDAQGGAKVLKPSGTKLTRGQVADWGPQTVPHLADKHKELAISEIQTAMMDNMLAEMTHDGDASSVKNTMVMLVEQAFLDPKLALLKSLCGMTKASLDHFGEHPELLKSFLSITGAGYSLAEHSVNVMAAAMLFSISSLKSKDDRIDLCIAALLHDIGRLELPEHLRLPCRQLENEEFIEVKKHPWLAMSKLAENEFSPEVRRGVMEHHERIDGSGYPGGIGELSIMGQVLGLADSFDALTGYARLNRGINRPLDALQLLKDEADAGKFGYSLLSAFALGLAG